MSTLIQQVRPQSPEGNSSLPSGSGLHCLGQMDPLLDRAMALAKIGTWSCNLADNRLSWSTGVYDLFGLPVRTALDRRQTVEMYTEESREALERLRTQAIAKRGTFTLDAQIERATGDKRWMRITGEVTDDKHGTPHLHGLKQDITDEKSRSEELRRLAENDTLTGLASRAVYEDRFLNRHRRTSSVMRLGALILFDLDGFKSINDRLGHAAGDACLKVFAERLSANFPKALLIARIGGDEFAVIVGDDEPKLVIEAHVARFLARLRAPILWREHMFTIAATSGLAIPSDPHSYDAEELFVSADLALYDAKRRFRSTPTLCHL